MLFRRGCEGDRPRSRQRREQIQADADAAPGAHPWTKTILSSIVGFILASGVVGAVISVYFQGRSWDYQNGTDKIAKDAAAVVSALESLDKIIDEKWLSTYEMDDEIKTRAEGDKLKAVTERFYSANKDWEQQHEILASTLEIAVDSQFGIDDPKTAILANSVECTTYALKGQKPNGADPLSVRALLEISYNCQNLIKGKSNRGKSPGGRWLGVGRQVRRIDSWGWKGIPESAVF